MFVESFCGLCRFVNSCPHPSESAAFAMPQFAANVSTMFTEWDFLDRFSAAADHGFKAVEVQFPYDHPPEAIQKRLERARVELVLMNTPPGDFAAGERGFAAVPDRADKFRASLAQA